MRPSERPKDPNAKFQILEGTSVAGAGRVYVVITSGIFVREGDDEGEMLFGEAFVATPTESKSWNVEPIRLTFPRGNLDIGSGKTLLEAYVLRLVEEELERHLVAWHERVGAGKPFPPQYRLDVFDHQTGTLWLRRVLGEIRTDQAKRWTLSQPLSAYLAGLGKVGAVRDESSS